MRLGHHPSDRDMTDDAAPPIIQRDGVVLISGAALPLMYRACLALVQRRHRDGLAAHPLLQLAVTTLHRVLALIQRRHRDGLSSHELTELRTALYQARMSAQRRKGAAYHLAESRCNGQGRLANPKTQRRSRVAMQNRR